MDKKKRREIYYKSVKKYLNEDKYDEAIKEYSKAIKIYP